MSNTFTSMFGNKALTKRVCRVAYTINNTQPVACTIIGDEPLFYMDFDQAFEEEEHLDLMEMEALESELLKLAESINAFDRFSEGPVITSEEKIEAFYKNADLFVKEHKTVTPDISKLLALLGKSRLASAYIATAAEHKVKIAYCDHIATAAYERASAKIVINPNLTMTEQALLVARELRRHYQHRVGALINPMMFHPDNAVLVNRAQTADLASSVVRIAWELQLAGEKEIWEHLENSSMGDLARAFARDAFVDFRTINNGHANAAVFEAWFLSERCRHEDRVLIQHMLADYQGYVFDQEEAAKAITPSIIAALGEMPFGKNYLSKHAMAIMEDPIFTDVRDRSNANFLWFIKFERSFKETEGNLEHDLQSSGVSPAAGFFGGSDSSTQDRKNGQKSADIITLYEGKSKGQSKTSKPLTGSVENLSEPPNGDNGSNIVYLRRGPTD